MFKRLCLLVAALCIIVPMSAFAEEEEFFEFKAGIALGTDVISIPTEEVDENGDVISESVNWNLLSFQPEFKFGPVRLGLDLMLHFHLAPNSGNGVIEIYDGDWVPRKDANGKVTFSSILETYLPKFMYISYGKRGEPIYAKIGSIDDFTLANGFIMANYANTLYLPAKRITGLDVGLDGTLFDFPYLGLEVLTNDLSKFNVLGGRAFVRPLIWSDFPIVKDMQLGFTYVKDTVDNDLLNLFGADIFVPIFKGSVFPLNAFAEMAFEPNETTGFMIGASGRLISFITYAAQIRLMQAGFIPSYFDSNYDAYREEKARSMKEAAGQDTIIAGWLANLGTSLLEDKLYFSASVDGPFALAPTSFSDEYTVADYPHLRVVAGVTEDLLAGFSMSALYEKYYLGKSGNFWSDLVSPKDAIISASVSYKAGAAVFTLSYNLTYNPDSPEGFDITSSLKSSVKF